MIGHGQWSKISSQELSPLLSPSIKLLNFRLIVIQMFKCFWLGANRQESNCSQQQKYLTRIKLHLQCAMSDLSLIDSCRKDILNKKLF